MTDKEKCCESIALFAKNKLKLNLAEINLEINFCKDGRYSDFIWALKKTNFFFDKFL